MAQRQTNLTGTADAAGALTLTFDSPGNYTARIRQVSVESADAAGGASGAVRLNGALVSPFVPHADAVSGEPPIDVQPGDVLTIEWTNAGASVAGRALIIWEPL